MHNHFLDAHNKKMVQGVLALVAGILMLLYTLGIIEACIDFIFILASVILITYGSLLLDLDKIIRKWLGR